MEGAERANATQGGDRHFATDDSVGMSRRHRLPRWAITTLSLAIFLSLWEFFGRDVNPVFGSYPSAIVEAFVELLRSGQLLAALAQSLQPFLLGYALAIVIGVPLGLVIGRFRTAEAALGIYVTARRSPALVTALTIAVAAGGITAGVGVLYRFSVGTHVSARSVLPGALGSAAGTALVSVGFGAYVSASTRYTAMYGASAGAVVAMVIAEFFTAISGLGAIIINSANNFDTAKMFVPVVVLMMLAIGLNALIGLVERRVAPWQAEIAGRDNR